MGLLDRFVPRFEGTHRVTVDRDSFLRRMEQRVRGGLFPGASDARNRYDLVRHGSGGLTLDARGWAAEAMIGLNHIELEVTPHGSGSQIDYRVHFWGWTKFCVKLSAFFLVMGTVVFFAVPYFPASWSNGVPVDLSRWFLAASTLFWGGLWPWILTAMHRPHARRALLRILTEVAGEPQASA